MKKRRALSDFEKAQIEEERALAAEKLRLAQGGGIVGKMQQDPRLRAIRAERLNKIFQMKTQGIPMREIAKSLGITERWGWALHEKAFKEFMGDHHRLRQRTAAQAMGTLERLKRTWTVRAFGGSIMRTDPKTGEQVEERFEPDEKAAIILIRIETQIARMLGMGRDIKIEHTGANGGPIQTANLGPMESARIMRETFGASKVDPYSGDAAALAMIIGDDDGADNNTQH